MAFVNNLDWGYLAPYWGSTVTYGGMDDRLGIVNYGTKIQSTDGNNGDKTGGWVKGSAPGMFKIQFKLGYAWGWSMMYAANINAASQDSISAAMAQDSSYNGLNFINNSSNNKFRVYTYAEGTTTTVTDTTGLNDVMITLWRDSDNVVKYKAGSNSTVTLGTFTDHWVFYCDAQSPCSCELISAANERCEPL